MATKTSPRELARRQREHLSRAGFTPAEIREFARLMNTEQPTDLPPCEQAA